MGESPISNLIHLIINTILGSNNAPFFINIDKGDTMNLLEKAVQEINEKDAEGAVAKIKMHIKMINANDEKIALYQKSNTELKKEISKLVEKGPLTVDGLTV
jgi:hypothetical protein